MWQRARVVVGDDPQIEPTPDFVGYLMWVKGGSVHEGQARDQKEGFLYDGRLVEINATHKGRPCMMPISILELLPEFAASVEIKELDFTHDA